MKISQKAFEKISGDFIIKVAPIMSELKTREHKLEAIKFLISQCVSLGKNTPYERDAVLNTLFTIIVKNYPEFKEDVSKLAVLL